MSLTTLCEILLDYNGKNIRRKTALKFLFPNIGDDTNLLDRNFEDDNEKFNGETYETLINLGFNSMLYKNSLGTTFVNVLSKYNNPEKIKDILYSYDDVIINNNNYAKFMDSFENGLDYIYNTESIYISKKDEINYADMIYTYIKYQEFSIALFLMVSILMLTPIIENDNKNLIDITKIIMDTTKHMNNTEHAVNIYDNFQIACEIIDDFKNYQKYIDDENITPKKYIPKAKEDLEFTKNEQYTDNINCYKEENVNLTIKPEDEYYFESLLNNPTCKEIHILSRFANRWASGDIYEKLINRLEDGIIVKMLLMDTNTPFADFYNDRQNHIKNNPFNIFEDLVKDFPNNFYLRYVTIPLTNRSFHDCSNHKMRVDFLTMPPISKNVYKSYFEKDSPYNGMYYEQYSKQFDELWEHYSRDINTIYDYSKFSYGIASNVNDKKFYNFYHHCIDNSKSIGVISPTASSWTSYNYLECKLFDKLNQGDFHIEFIVLNPDSYNFKIALENRKYACTSSIINLDRFKDLIEKYPNQVSVYATDLFISNTITIDFSNEIMRVDDHILNSKSSFDIKPSMIIPNNQTDIYGYYSEYLEQYEFIKNHKDTHKLELSSK